MIPPIHIAQATITAPVEANSKLSSISAQDEKKEAEYESGKTSQRKVLRLELTVDGIPIKKGIRYVETAEEAHKINEERLLKLKQKGDTKPFITNLYVPLKVDAKGQKKIVYINFNSLLKNLYFVDSTDREDAYNNLLVPRNRDSPNPATKRKIRILDILSSASVFPENIQADDITNLVDRLKNYYHYHNNMDLRRFRVNELVCRPVSSILQQKMQLASDRILYNTEAASQTTNYRIFMGRRMCLSETITEGHDQEGEDKYKDADKLIQTWLKEKRVPTLEMIMELNYTLGKNSYFNGGKPGELRTIGKEVNAFDDEEWSFVAGKHVKPEMESFIKWLSEGLEACDAGANPVLLAAQAAVRLVSIHPFNDGNGRTSRLIMDYILQRYGLPPAVLSDSFIAVFGGVPEKSVMTMEAAVDKVRKGIEESCKILGIASPFLKPTLKQRIAWALCCQG